MQTVVRVTQQQRADCFFFVLTSSSFVRVCSLLDWLVGWLARGRRRLGLSVSSLALSFERRRVACDV